METVDIFIAGGGPAGLMAAAAFAGAGASVLVADPAPPPDPAAPDRDLRSTAFLPPALDLFRRCDLWPSLVERAVPLEVLRIVDLAGDPPSVRTDRAFRSEDGAPLAYNLMNRDLRQALLAHLARQPGVEVVQGAGFAGLLARTSEARVRLTDGRKLSARLAVAADGRDSPLREAAGIAADSRRYGQKALAFAVTHPEPHGNVSTEFYLAGGPFTMVPLPDRDGLPCSAVVWCDDGPVQAARAALPDAAFAADATARSGGVFGPLTLATGRALWPVITRTARRLTATRTVLIAEAAHVLPPIGAQGLNTSVADILALEAALREEPAALGTEAMLARFEEARRADIAARAATLDLYNRLTRAPDPLSRSLRRLGLIAVHDVAPLRRAVMRAGSGG